MNVLKIDGVDKIMNLDDKGKIGYLFEVDLHYGYALASEKKKIKNVVE